MTTGIIYCIHCILTGKKYIGQTGRDLSTRIRYHGYDVSKGSKCKLHSSIRTYGWDKHIYGIIEETDSLNERECYYIQLYDTLDNGLNSSPGGGKFPRFSGESHPLYGVGHSEESKKKISENHHDVNGPNNPMFGKSHSDETKAKISKQLKGKDHRKWSQGRKDTHANIVSCNYLIVFDDDSEITISNLKQWAKDNNYNVSSLHNIMSGKTKRRHGRNKKIKSVKKLS